MDLWIKDVRSFFGLVREDRRFQSQKGKIGQKVKVVEIVILKVQQGKKREKENGGKGKNFRIE